MAYRPQDQLASGLSNNDKRTLLDIASGGAYKTSKDFVRSLHLLGPKHGLLQNMAEPRERFYLPSPFPCCTCPAP